MNEYYYEIDNLIRSSEKIDSLRNKIMINKNECLNQLKHNLNLNVNSDINMIDKNQIELNMKKQCFEEENKLQSILFSNKSKLLLDTYDYCYRKGKFKKDEYIQYKLLKIKIDDKLDYAGINECIQQRFLNKIELFENSVLSDFNM